MIGIHSSREKLLLEVKEVWSLDERSSSRSKSSRTCCLLVYSHIWRSISLIYPFFRTIAFEIYYYRLIYIFILFNSNALSIKKYSPVIELEALAKWLNYFLIITIWKIKRKWVPLKIYIFWFASIFNNLLLFMHLIDWVHRRIISNNDFNQALRRIIFSPAYIHKFSIKRNRWLLISQALSVK
jgi:hypothetical protein